MAFPNTEPNLDNEQTTSAMDEENTENTQDEQEPESQELSEDLVKELKNLMTKFGMEEMPNRRQELIRAREARYFWRGFHYPLFNSDQATWVVPQEGGLPYSTNGGDADGNSRFYYVTNFYTALGKSLISSLVGATPEVVFLPCNPKQIDDINAAKEAEKYKKVFFHAVDIGQILNDVARYFWTDGRTIGWVRQDTDPKYGYNEEGEPKTQEIVELGGVLEWKVPITARDKSQFHYAMYSIELSVAQCKDQWKDKEAKIKAGMSGPASDQFDRLCRLATLQGTDSMYAGDTYAHVVTVTNCWIRPSAFMLIKSEATREQLQQMFPRGVRVTFAGNEFMEAHRESMDDVIEVCLPQPGDGMAVASLGEFVIPVQKRVNNKINLAQEAWEKGTPIKFVDSKAIDEQGMRDQMGSPETYMPIKNPYGAQSPLENLFYKEDLPQQPQDMMLSIEKDMGPVAQMVGGVQPALFGAPMQNAKTAAVYAQARDQALGSLALTYKPLKTWLANITEKAVSLAETREQDIMDMVPDERTGGYADMSIKIDTLKAGRYKCKPVVDDGGIPEAPSAQKAGLMQMIQFMGQSPQFQALLQHPDNQYVLKSVTGIKGFEIPGADSRNKQLREIEEMHDNFLAAKSVNTQGGPRPPNQADVQKVAQHETMVQAAGGAAANPKPSDLLQSTVPVDPEVDDHSVEAQECSRWLNSDEGQQAKQFQPGWYADVRQHMIEHKRALTQGVDAAMPLQDRIPDPAVAMQAQSVQGAIQDHAQESQNSQLAAGGPPVVPGGAPIQ